MYDSGHVAQGDLVVLAASGSRGWNDQAVDGISGNDVIDGGDGTDTAVVRASLADVVSCQVCNGVVTLITSLGADSLRSVERVQFGDALFALDTQAPGAGLPGGHAWQAAALFHAGFGALPGGADLSHWTAQADQSSSMGELAQHMIEWYAPGVSSADFVAYVYQQLLQRAPSAEAVQAFVDQIGPGRAFATQGDLLAYAANLPLNTDGLVGFVGSAQQLDPLAF